MNECHFGDCRDVLRRMIDDGVRVNMCVTSPPYWGLRRYLEEGHESEHLELGSEPTLAEFVANMVEVFGLVREILTDDGTCWINMGDTMLPNKCEAMAPHRLAMALMEDGWICRQTLIWAKPNPMPESVTDRCTKAHEYVFLLAKRERYFFDAEAIREPQVDMDRGSNPLELKGHSGKSGGIISGTREATKGMDSDGAKRVYNPAGRNRRSVWTIPSQAYSDAHFATFPEALVEPMILAGTSAHGHCPACGKGWVRVVERGELVPDAPGYKPRGNDRGDAFVKNAMVPAGATKGHPNFHYESKTLGWEPSCDHNLPPVPGVVLDPFLGSGTVAKVAQSLGRNWLGIELNPAFEKFQDNRITQYGFALS